ncbi:hypothetical protein C2W62_10705 [Candidatus Entotheonella serta]|nr:hypothetical protein C2W62_10705 [Candidatus Entotheonella serta]
MIHVKICLIITLGILHLKSYGGAIPMFAIGLTEMAGFKVKRNRFGKVMRMWCLATSITLL